MSLTSFPTPNWLEPILTKVWSMKQIWCLNLNFDLGDDDDLEVSPTTNQQTRPRYANIVIQLPGHSIFWQISDFS